jgi:hypothetical protein
MSSQHDVIEVVIVGEKQKSPGRWPGGTCWGYGLGFWFEVMDQ